MAGLVEGVRGYGRGSAWELVARVAGRVVLRNRMKHRFWCGLPTRY